MKISFRTEDLKYIATLTSSSNDLGRLELREEELYRFLEDPAEQKNIQNDSLLLIDTFRRELRGSSQTLESFEPTGNRGRSRSTKPTRKSCEASVTSSNERKMRWLKGTSMSPVTYDGHVWASDASSRRRSTCCCRGGEVPVPHYYRPDIMTRWQL